VQQCTAVTRQHIGDETESNDDLMGSTPGGQKKRFACMLLLYKNGNSYSSNHEDNVF